MFSIFVDSTNLIFIHESFGKDIGTQTLGSRVVNTHTGFGSNPSFAGRVKTDFIHIAFRQLGVGTGEALYLLCLSVIAEQPLRSTYPKISFGIRFHTEDMSFLEKLRITLGKIFQRQRFRIQYHHTATIRTDVIFSLIEADCQYQIRGQDGFYKTLDHSGSLIYIEQAVTRTDDLLLPFVYKRTDGKIGRIKQRWIIIRTEKAVLIE